MNTKMKKFPKTPFKLDCGDKPEVRQWLKDNGCAWSIEGSASENFLDKRYLFIDNRLYLSYCDNKKNFNEHRIMLFNPFKKKSKLEKRVEALERIANKQASLILKQSLTINKIVDKQLSGVNEAIAVNPIQSGRYKPEHYDRYYFISESGRIASTGNSLHDVDSYNILTGNCYRTKQEAEQALARQRALVRVNDRIDQLNDGWVADYAANEYKWFIASLDADAEININALKWSKSASIFKASGSFENLNVVIVQMKEDIKLAAGWER